MKIRRVNPMLKSLILGICVYAIIGIVLVLVAAEDKWYYLIGFGIGILLATLMVINMNTTIEEAVHMGEDEGYNRGRFMYAIRTIIVIVTLVFLLLTDIGNPILAIIGLFSLKFSAYFQLIATKFKK